jgi:hypothetical protein
MMQLAAEEGYHSYGMLAIANYLFMMRRLRIAGLLAFTKILGMDPQEAEELCHDAVAATRDKTLHSWAPQ